MTATIKYQSHVNNAKAFSDAYSVPNQDSLYLGLAKSTPWIDGDNDPIPAVDNIDDENLFWSDLIGMQKVTVSHIMMGVPRINWSEGVAYAPLSTTSTTAYTDPPGSYVYVDGGGGDFNVYRCVLNNGVTGSIPPAGTAATPVTTPDGFQWQYMFSLTTTEERDMLTTNWLPVPVQNIVEPQLSSGDPAAHITLGARYIIINIILTAPNEGGLPAVSYRKVSLVSNPLDQTGVVPVQASVALPDGISPSLSGLMIHLDHKYPVTRVADQTEEMTIILEF